MAKKYLVKLLRKEKLAKDTWLFAFQKPEGYAFTSGQYQTFTLPLSDGKSDWRDMTIASSPGHPELWLVTKMKEEASPFKQKLFSLTVGDEVILQGPSGGFTIRDNKPHVFLAGGIGINVFYAILMDTVAKNIEIPMTLLVSFSTKEDMLFYQQFKKIENEKIKIVYTLTKDDWDGEKGRISKSMLQKYAFSMSDNIYMVAGGQEFVDAMNELLLGMGVPEENIRIDYFTGY